MKYVIQLFYDWHIPVIQNLSVGAVGRPVIAQHAGKITRSLDQMMGRPPTSTQQRGRLMRPRSDLTLRHFHQPFTTVTTSNRNASNVL